MIEVNQIKLKFIDDLSQLYGAEEAEALFWLSIEHVLQLEKLQIRLQKPLDLTVEHAAELNQILDDLKRGEPIQYVLGFAWFYNQRFSVNKSVLIPRPETEELVAWIVEENKTAFDKNKAAFDGNTVTLGGSKNLAGSLDGSKVTLEENKVTLNESKADGLRVLDIGTGSGCIPISLKKYLPGETTVYGVDISEDALAVARLNARQLDCPVHFFKTDILDTASVNFVFDSEVIEATPEGVAFDSKAVGFDSKFDIIVSNPPYITPSEKQAMHNNVLDFEPHLALFVEQDEPLIFYNAIAGFALKNLKRGEEGSLQGGKLYFEINKLYGADVVDLLKEKGFEDVQLRKDMAGNDRMVSAVLN